MVDTETAASVFLGDSPQVPSDRSASGKIILESTLTGLLLGSVTAGQGPPTGWTTTDRGISEPQFHLLTQFLETKGQFPA